MKKTIIILYSVLFVNILFANKINYAKVKNSTISSTNIEFNIDDFKLIPVETNLGSMNIAKFNNGSSISKLGAPDLHKFSKSIIIPDNSKMKVKIISSDYTDYNDISIAPSKGTLSRKIDPNEIPYNFGQEYDENIFFPKQIVALQEPYILRDLRGQTVTFYPLQYNPITKTLRVFHEINVKIFSEGSDTKNILNRNSSIKNIPKEFQHIYEDHFINYSYDTRFDYLSDQGNMLIISYGSFINAMQPFVEWKNKKGIPTEIVDVSDIGTNSTAIKNFISNYYSEKGLTFLLLVGDVAQIPSPTISGSASDPSYGFIEGNDSYAEVIVGRFSGSIPSQISTQVERSINYERYPQSGADWYDNAMGVASTQGPGFGGYTDAEFNNFLWDTVLSDYTYDSYQYSYDGSGSVSIGMEIINNGVSFINYTGHGSISSWGNGAPLSTSNVNSLTNNNMLPFIISVACNNGEFNSTDECFGESWLRSTNNGEPTGAVGFIGSTISMSWEPPMHGQYGMNLILTESYEGHITRSVGGITTNGCLYMNDAQGSSGINETNYWTLFGDPSLEIRTDQPSTLNINHDNAIVLGQSEISINTNIDNALVAISKNNELLTFAYSENGSATLDLSNIELLPGDYELIVTAFNSFPYESSIQVITPEGPYITLDSYEIVSESNSNGIAEFDEIVSIQILANNVGVDNATTVCGEVKTTDTFITLLGENNQTTDAVTICFGDIPANVTASSAESVTFSIAHNVPDAHIASFSIDFWSPENNWNGNFNINISAPHLTVSNPSFTDENNDGIWDAGETITLSLLLNNEGTADHFSYPGVQLNINSEEAIISDELDFFWLYGIMSGESVPVTFSVLANEDANMGEPVNFTANIAELNCEANCIEGDPINFTFTIGLPFDDNLYEPLNLTAIAEESGIVLNWEEPFQCPEDQFPDCIGQCVDSWYEAWLGDGLCDDGTWGVYFNCEEFNNDGGDCGEITTCEDDGLITCPDGSCEATIEDCPEITCETGYVEDCSGDGDCCPESWIGDGYADCEDQAYDCDLTCYDNDGGDCNGRSDNPKIKKDIMVYKSRLNADFSSSTYISKNRQLDGYFVYKNGSYVTFTSNLQYIDNNVIADNEYCYHVSAVYEQGQSTPSNTACAIALGEAGIPGDLNNDESINILDVITLANMVLGTTEPTSSADINNDGGLNILDIITLVNMILNGRSIDNIQNIGNKAFIHQEGKVISLSANGNVAGIQMKIDAENIIINEDLKLNVQSAFDNGVHNIIIYGINGETISGNKIKLFTVSGEYTISEVIIANILSNAMDVSLSEKILPNTFVLEQNYPNPFNPSTNINFTIGSEEIINLNIYDLNGRLIKSLINNSNLNVGKYSIIWNGTNNNEVSVPSGMYFYKLEGKNIKMTKKMILMK